MTEIKKRRDDDLEQSSSSANALRNASSFWKHIKQQQQYSSQELRDGWRTRIKKYVTGSQQRWKYCVRISSYQRRKVGTHIRYDCCAVVSCRPLSGCCCFSWFPWPVFPSWLPVFSFSSGVATNPRILWFNLRIQHSNSLWFVSLLSFTCTLSSSQDSMHCALSLTVCTCTPCQWASFISKTDSFSWCHDPYTLACKARPSFDGCGTSLSVSEILKQRSQVKSMRFKLLKEIYRQHEIHWTVGMKSTSIRFKVSLLMKELLHRHHLSAELRNQQSVIHHNLGVTPSCSYRGSTQCQKQHQHCLQVRVRHHRASRKLQWQYTILLFRRLFFTNRKYRSYSDSPWLWRTQQERSRGNCYWQVASTNRIQKLENELQSAVSHSSQYPRAAMLWIGKVEDAESIDDLITSTLISWDPIPDFENLDFRITCELRKIQTGNFKKQVTTGEGKAQSEKRSLRDRQIAWTIYDFIIFSGENEAILDFRDEPFDTKWDEVWSQH